MNDMKLNIYCIVKPYRIVGKVVEEKLWKKMVGASEKCHRPGTVGKTGGSVEVLVSVPGCELEVGYISR